MYEIFLLLNIMKLNVIYTHWQTCSS